MTGFGIDLERRELLQAEGEVEVAVGKVGGPRRRDRPSLRPTPHGRDRGRRTSRTRTRTNVKTSFLNSAIVFPLGHAGAVVGIAPAAPILGDADARQRERGDAVKCQAFWFWTGSFLAEDRFRVGDSSLVASPGLSSSSSLWAAR